MYQDMGISRDLNGAYKAHLGQSDDVPEVDFQIQVIENLTVSFEMNYLKFGNLQGSIFRGLASNTNICWSNASVGASTLCIQIQYVLLS